MKPTRHTFEAVLSWIPLGTFLCLATFTAIAMRKEGHWPLYGRPDPSTLRLPLLYGASLLSYPVTIVAVAVGLIGLACAPERWTRKRAWTFAAGAMVWGACIGPISGLFTWLID
jgi:hypothetical protein